MNPRNLRNVAAWWLVLTAAFALLILVPARALAADDATIAHAEAEDGELRVLVDVPADAEVSLAEVTATLDDEPLAGTASLAASGATVERTAVLAIDTSNSMRRQGRFAAAKDAATAYLAAVPDDVAVGVVTFNREVTVALAPTTDRGAARQVVADLTLARQTRLHDGIITAVETAGETGQRSVLVLSDGADFGSDAELSDAVATVQDTHTLVDVVSLGQRGARLAQLRQIAVAGNGEVLEAEGDTLAAAFEAEADVLANQVLLTAPLPDGFDATEATVEVTLPAGGGNLVARAFVPIQEVVDSGPASTALPTEETAWSTPGWLLPVGIGVLALGALGVAFMVVPAKPQPMTIAERVDSYIGGAVPAADPAAQPTAEPVLNQAKQAAADLLHRNESLETGLATRLGAAGSGFKPSEWLILHVGVVLGAGLVGLLLGRGSLLLGVLFLVVGAALPPIYLRWQAGRRRKAFDAALPEILQLMSGALAAGLSLAQAVDTVVREGPEPIASEFKRVLVENRIGVGLEDAFEGVAARFDSKDFSWVVMAIRIQRQVGGNLAELLTTVAETIRERAYLRRQVQTLAAEGKLSAMILCALPPVFLVFLMLFRGEYLAPMLENLLGWLMLGGASLWLALGVFWMSRLVKVEV